MSQAPTSGYELSSQQKAWWKLGRVGTCCQWEVEVRGEWDQERLRSSFEGVVSRHEALRAGLVEVRGLSLPLWRVEESASIVWSEGEEGVEEGPELLEREAERLRAGDEHVRVAVRKLSTGSRRVVLTVRGLNADLASLEQVFEEWSRAASGAGLEAVGVQYGQFSAWQDELMSGEESESGRRHWVKQREEWSATRLPWEREGTGGRGRVACEVSESTRQRWCELGESGGGAAGVLLGAWGHVLRRVTGERAGVSVRLAGRGHDELRELVGLVEKWAPLSVGGEEWASLGEAARGCGEQLEEAQEWGESLEMAESELRGAAFEYDEGHWSVSRGGLDWTRRSARGAWGGWTVCLRGEGCRRLELSYDTGRLEEGEARRLLGYVERVLEWGVRHPREGLGGLGLVGAEERERLLSWAEGGRAADVQGTLVERLARWASEHGERVALVCGGESLSYGALNEQANRLGRWLRGRGVAGEECVGLCVGRTVRAGVGMWGIWKSGAAYVALEGDQPASRLREQARVAGLKWVVTDAAYAGAWQDCGIGVVRLDGDEWCGQSGEELSSRRDPDELAYVLYTSGSTGTPKGVGVSHAGLMNYTSALAIELGVGAGEAWSFASVTTLNADLGHTAVWVGWATGGTVHLVDYEVSTDGVRLGSYLSEHGIDVLKIVPSHLRALLETGESKLLPRRVLVLGGEALGWELVERIRELGGACAVMNHYGPTETTVGALTRRVGAEERGRGGVELGRPISGMRAYVLDEAQQLVPAGVTGELWLGGAGLARGYVGAAGQTAERFLPDMLRGDGTRLYRTGDRARVSADGQVEFLGRGDAQVKIRGYRIEPGEVEAALRRHADVGDAAVVVRTDVPGQPYLAAYVAPLPGRRPESTALKAHVRTLCPEHMVPQSVSVLPALPVTRNGKLDRAALPALEKETPRGAYEEPRSALERSLARIWADVLRLPRVGIRDNFFELGGDSILSIQVVSRARSAGAQLSVKQLFQHPTIAELAQVARAVNDAGAADAGPVAGPVALTPIQRWFFEQEWPEPWHFNQAVLLESRANVREEGLRAVVAAMLSHHDGLRTRYLCVDGEWRQQVAERGAETDADAVALEVVADARELEQRCAWWQTRFDLERGPLLRVVLFRLGGGQPDRVLLAAHHLVVDGVSWRVLLEDLERGYGQWSRGERLDFGARTASFQRWSARLAELAASRAVQAQWAYWEKQCARAGARRGRASDAAGTGSVTAALDEVDTRALLAEVPGVYGTRINDALLLALVETVGSDGAGGTRRGLRVELEGHGREESVGLDVSRTVGWFTAQYPLWLEIEPARGEGEKLKAIKEQLRQVPDAGLGYGLLRYHGGDEARARRLRTDGGVRFNYLGQLDAWISADALFRPASESPGATRAEAARAAFALTIDASVAAGRLRTAWTYRASDWSEAEVRALADAYLAILRRLVTHCRLPGVGGYTPSDFPLAGLDQGALDKFFPGPRRVEDVYPLSPLQQGMLFHTLLDPSSGAYVAQTSCTLSGDVDEDALDRAWRLVVERHAPLRTSFLWEGWPRPLQVVHPRADSPLASEDWSGLDPAAIDSRWQAALASDRAEPFDLSRAPAMRLRLVRTGASERRLVWTYHHLIQDGWSGSLLLNELFRAYEAFRRGGQPELPLTRPFGDYLRWLERQDLSEAEAFWRAELRGFTRPTRVAADEPPGDSRYVTTDYRLDAADSEALERFARAHRITPGTIVQGAWGILLSHVTGERDIVFGATVSGRPAELPGVESIVGPFINAVPLRLRVASDRRVGEWLLGLHDYAAELRQYEYAALGDVRAWSDVPQGLPLFDCVLAYQNFPLHEGLAGLVAALRIGEVRMYEHTHYPLALMVTPGAELAVRATHCARRLPVGRVELLLRSFGWLLARIARGPDERLGDGLDALRAFVEEQRRQDEAARLERRRRGLSLSRPRTIGAGESAS